MSPHNLCLEKAIIDELSQSVFAGLLSSDGTLIYVNRAALAYIGKDLAEVQGQPFDVTPWWSYSEKSRRNLRTAIESGVAGKSSRFDILVRGQDDSVLAMDFSLHPVFDRDGNVTYLVPSAYDISEREAAAQRIQYLTSHDELTGLPKRGLLQEHLRKAIAVSERSQFKISVLQVNLDHFKLVVDTFGHGVGDELLKLVAQRLRDYLSDPVLVARVGGDEFTVVLDGRVDDDNVIQTAKCILNIFNKHFEIGGQELFVTCRIGIATYPDHASGADELLKYAGIAESHAKQMGSNTLYEYKADTTIYDPSRLTLASALHQALQRDQLQLYYQPQIDLRTHRIIGLEALLRWQHPQRGIITPAQFIPLAEESGLIVAIGEWTLHAACQQIKMLRSQDISPPHIAINLSARQFRQENLVREIEAAAYKAEIKTTDLEIELTESMLMHDVESAIRTMRELKELGVILALDDFGTGYSSLSYLKRFPIDTLKIDQSFVREITTDQSSLAIVEAIIAMATRLGLNIVAEGVETNEQCELLRARGCNQMQGYFFSKPLPPDHVTELLQAFREDIPNVNFQIKN